MLKQTVQFGQGNARFRSPKTILGFFAILIGILGTASAATIGILARYSELHEYIPIILCFFAVIFLVTLVGVFVTAWKDPSILMLGEISGEVFLENRRLTLGDSSLGERREKIVFQNSKVSSPSHEGNLSQSSADSQ